MILRGILGGFSRRKGAEWRGGLRVPGKSERNSPWLCVGREKFENLEDGTAISVAVCTRAGRAGRSSTRKRGRGGEIERNNVRDVPFVRMDFSRPCTPATRGVSGCVASGREWEEGEGGGEGARLLCRAAP